MPQSERSQNIKQLLKWIEAKSKGRNSGVTIQAIIKHCQIEITDMGASIRTIRTYVEALERNNLIYTEGIRFLITEQGKNWLERKFLQ